jgi:DEAD/DEAH box helicase domain-containing protein
MADETKTNTEKTLEKAAEKKPRKIFLDIETKNSFQEVGKADPVMLDISVVCIYDSETDKYTSYLQEQFAQLWPIIEQADVLVTFNGDHFDIPLLNKYYNGDLTKIKSLDIMKEIKNVLGHRIGLSLVAQATLGVSKSGHGLEAIEWWRAGEIDKIIKYCIDDVKITREIYEYALKHKKLKFKDGLEIREFPLNTTDWEKHGQVKMTYSLPF